MEQYTIFHKMFDAGTLAFRLIWRPLWRRFMAKIESIRLAEAVVVTDVSDLAEVVGDGGWVVTPADVVEMRGAICEALNNIDEARKRGALARQRCEQYYNYDAAFEVLDALMTRVTSE